MQLPGRGIILFYWFLEAAGFLRQNIWLAAFACLLCMSFQRCQADGVSHPRSQRFPGRQHISVGQTGLPLVFERNTGQFPLEARYIGREPGYNLVLTRKGALLEFRDEKDVNRAVCEHLPAKENSPAPALPIMSRTSCSVASLQTVELELAGANREALPVGKKALLSYSNYIIGNDPNGWHTRSPHFAEVWYPEVYPGVDLAFYGKGDKLEYDFVVAPRARADRIQFSITGVSQDVREERNGDLIIYANKKTLLMRKPVVLEGDTCSHAREFESTRGKGGCRVLTGGRFRLSRKRGVPTSISFVLPHYDHTKTLVIDPVVSFSTLFGGNLGTGASGIQVDSAGDIYILGSTNSTNLGGTSAFQPSLAGDSDAFVAKLSADGSQLIYVTYLGGSKAEFPHGMAVDSSGNVYVTGQTYSSDFPIDHAFQSNNSSGAGAFVSKLSPDGTTLLYSTYLGGRLSGSGQSIALDNSDEPVVVGWTYANDFPTLNPIQSVHAADQGNTDAFVTKLNAQGTALVFSSYIGGNAGDLGQGVAIDTSGNIYVAGITSSSDFPTTGGSFQSTYTASSEGNSFITKLNPTGSELSYSTYLAGSQAAGVAVNAAGNAFVTGLAGISGFPTTAGAFQTSVSTVVLNTHAFVSELNATGSSLVYSTYIAGSDIDSANAIAVDKMGNAYVTGVTHSQDFPLQAPVQASKFPSVPAAFVSMLNPSGSNLVFSTYLGGGADGYGDQQGYGIAVDGSGNIYAAGETTTPGFPIVNAIQSALTGSGDAFIVKFLYEPAPVLSFSSSTLSFSAEVVGVASPQQDITVTNTGGAPLMVSSIASVGDFSATNTCSSSIAAGANCRIQVVFTPTQFGTRTGQLSIASNATIVPQTISLTGSGQDFSLMGSPGTNTVTAGKAATYTLNVSPNGGFNQKVSFTCTGAPNGAVCTVSPASVTPDGTNAIATSVTVTTRASSASLTPGSPAWRDSRGNSLALALMLPVGALWLAGVITLRRFRAFIMVFFACVALASMGACGGGGSSASAGGGGGSPGTPSGSYSITVTGTSAGGDSHGAIFNLIVN
jgi:hypothetical protein